MPAPVGSRKLWAFIATCLTISGLGAVGAFKLAGDTLAGTPTGLGSSVTMALLYYCGGNVGEHFAKGGKEAAKPDDAEGSELDP